MTYGYKGETGAREPPERLRYSKITDLFCQKKLFPPPFYCFCFKKMKCKTDSLQPKNDKLPQMSCCFSLSRLNFIVIALNRWLHVIIFFTQFDEAVEWSILFTAFVLHKCVFFLLFFFHLFWKSHLF